MKKVVLTVSVEIENDQLRVACETPYVHYDRGFDFEEGVADTAKVARNFVFGFVADMDWATYVRDASNIVINP